MGYLTQPVMFVSAYFRARFLAGAVGTSRDILCVDPLLRALEFEPHGRRFSSSSGSLVCVRTSLLDDAHQLTTTTHDGSNRHARAVESPHSDEENLWRG